MFTEKEKEYMRSIGLNLDFDNLSDDDYILIEEVVGDRLTLSELDENYYPTPNGFLCYEILDKLS